MSQNIRILVVGGTGFIGRHIARRAASLGWIVTSLSLNRREEPIADGVEMAVADVSDFPALSAALSDPSFEYVVDCFGDTDNRSFFEGEQHVWTKNILGVHHLVSILNREVLRAYVHIGSSEEYGLSPAPQVETVACAPLTPYAFAHNEVARYLQLLNRATGFPSVILRLFNTYGPYQSAPRFIPAIIEGGMLGGHIPCSAGIQEKDFVYIDDVVDAIVAALTRPDAKGEVINICSGVPVAVRDVVTKIVEMLGRGVPGFESLPTRPTENSCLVGDGSKARSLLGWEPRVSLDQGLSLTIQWRKGQALPGDAVSKTMKGPGTGASDEVTIPKRPIPVSRSFISAKEKQRVNEVLDRQYLGMGDEVRQFEEGLAGFFGRPAVCVVNGTAAVHLAVQGCGIGAGDEVLVPSLTYIATFQAISATGAKPVACDIQPDTCLLDLRDAEKRLTPKTRAVMPVHYTGGVGDLDAIYAFAHRHELRVIEDAAHAFGTTYNGKRIGARGDVACFSFDGIKNITSGEGGCVVSGDPVLLRRIQNARLLGVERDTEKRYSGQRSWEFDVTEQGWRYHMSNVMAAIGLEQLKRFPELAAARQHLARRYDQLLRGHPRIRPLSRDYGTVVPHIYVVRIEGIQDRKSLMNSLLEQGIQTGIHYQINHVLSLYHDPQALPLPVTDAAFPELLTLPLHPNLTENDVEYVCDRVIAALHR